MDKATSCVRVYPKSKKQNYSVEQQWYLVKYCEPGRFDLADLELKNDFALSCLHFFLTLFCVFDFNGTKGRNGSLFDKIFSLDLCTPKSRSYCYKGLAILKEKGLITVRTKNLAANQGVCIVFTDRLLELATKSKSDPVSPKQTRLKLVEPERSSPEHINYTDSIKILPTSPPVCTPVHEKHTVDRTKTRVKNSNPRSQDPVLKADNARRSDFRAKQGKTQKRDPKPIRFQKILVNGGSTRSHRRTINAILTAVYCVAQLDNIPGQKIRWLLSRAILENEWIDCPAHSGIEWNRLLNHWPDMLKAEKDAVCRDTIIPRLADIKTDPPAAVSAAGIRRPPAAVSSEDKKAIERLKQLVKNGEMTEPDALIALKAQQFLSEKRKQLIRRSV